MNAQEYLEHWRQGEAAPNGGSLKRVVMRRIELTKLKRYPTMKRHLLGKMVRIFSHEWRMWWRKDGNGYTPNRDDAWVTRFEHAWDVSSHAGPEKGIEYEAA